jgi:hypothetical protein
MSKDEMVKMTYVPNMIGILTHGVSLWHHGLRIGVRNPKSPMEPPHGEEGRRKKKEKEGRGPLGGLVTPKELA